MNTIDIVNGIIFNMLGLSIESFDDRLICQKKIYLLQALGVDLGYKYNWYVHGPYSPTLTNYAYSHIDIFNSYDFSGYELNEDAVERIAIVNDIANDRQEGCDEASWYELLASIVYVFSNLCSWGIVGGTDATDNEVIRKVIEYKPQYDEDNCIHALEILRNRNFDV